ncbi:hypothetical protein D3C85_1681310 [compost metagenome]
MMNITANLILYMNTQRIRFRLNHLDVQLPHAILQPVQLRIDRFLDLTQVVQQMMVYDLILINIKLLHVPRQHIQ